ncbi:SusD/RagB family nutrient-binding outer membrane lipoprotein [Spirosoma koreense]
MVLAACNPSDFGNKNIDPNNPSTPNTNLLLSNAIRSLGSQTAGIAGFAKDLYPQYLGEIQYTSESRFQSRVYDYGPIYSGPLTDLQTIINLNTDAATKDLPYVKVGGSTANQLAAARILKGFYFLHITDRWGDVPYSTALKGASTLQPVFDKQQTIYTSLFKEFKEAAAQFDSGTLNGDFLFNGSTDRWKKWAASLRLTMALRLSKVDPTTGKTEFQAAMKDGVLASNADNVVFKYLADANNQDPYYNNYDVSKRYDYAVSEPFINVLTALKDPRLPIYADKTTDGGLYKGMPYGLRNGTGYNSRNVSLIGAYFRAQNAPLTITTYNQILFSEAEAAKLGWIDGGDVKAEEYYLKGIQASFDQYNLGASTTYVAQAGVAYNPAKAVELIQTQKWIANYLGNGYETWAEYRRTGFPALSPGPEPLTPDKLIPRRQAYPTTERDLNSTNYQAVLSSQGPDELNTRVWWDK